MSKKRKKGMGKKAQQRQMTRRFENFDPSLSVAAHIVRNHPILNATDATMHKIIKDYFLAHPTKTSTTFKEIVEYFVASAKSIPNSSEIDSQNESLNKLTSFNATSEASQTNSQEKSSDEFKLLDPFSKAKASSPPLFGERLLLLVLSKEERVNIPGDLEEEYRGIAAKQGARYAKLWYYKQVVASGWPLIRKAVRWGVIAWVGERIRRFI